MISIIKPSLFCVSRNLLINQVKNTPYTAISGNRFHYYYRSTKINGVREHYCQSMALYTFIIWGKFCYYITLAESIIIMAKDLIIHAKIANINHTVLFI